MLRVFQFGGKEGGLDANKIEDERSLETMPGDLIESTGR